MELHLGVIDRAVVRDLAAERLHGEVKHDEGSDERVELLALLERHAWRKEAAAAERGVHVATLYRQMQRLRISARAVQVR
jgi:transcriptional regulator of acetoin/glycerol metabolism